MRTSRKAIFWCPQRVAILGSFLSLFFFLGAVFAQDEGKFEKFKADSDPQSVRRRGAKMLGQIKEAFQLYYFDKTFGGIDLNAKFKLTEEMIKTVNTAEDVHRVIARLMLEFGNSHTKFFPPFRNIRVDYGISMQIIGRKCYVLDVTSGSDAEKKGVRIGDEILMINGIPVDQTTLPILLYSIHSLEPLKVLPMRVITEGGIERNVEVASSAIKENINERIAREKREATDPFICQEISASLIGCKLETFLVGRDVIDKMMKKVEPYSKMILDLRGNGGGYAKTGDHLTSFFFDREVKVADWVLRKRVEERISKPKRNGGFKGELLLLVDKRSASASEIFARTIQLQNRGKVIGDNSSGSVMMSYSIPMAVLKEGIGQQPMIMPFSISLTVADVIMSDGKRLEGVGVIPDYPILPKREDIINRYDPALAFAAKELGANLSPIDAGKLKFLYSKSKSGDLSQNDPDLKP